MGRYKIIDENEVYFTTHTIVEWLPVFVKKNISKSLLKVPLARDLQIPSEQRNI